jgi:hypothetical protein
VKKLVDEYLESKKEEMSQMQIAAEDAKTISALVKAKLGGGLQRCLSVREIPIGKRSMQAQRNLRSHLQSS